MIYKSPIKYIVFLVLLILFLLYTSRFFNYVNWDSTLAGQISYFIFGSILLLYLFFKNRGFNPKTNFNTTVLCLAAIPFITIAMSYAEFGQSPIASFKALFPHFTWLLYFLFHKYRLSEKSAIHLLLGFVFVVFFIQVIQQFTSSDSLFGIYTKEQLDDLSIIDIAEIRNGLYRFRLPGNGFISMIVLYYFWIRIQKRFSYQSLIFILISLATIYLTLTRQILFTAIVTLSISFLFVKNSKMKVSTLVLTSIFILLILSYSDILFSNFLLQTKNDVSLNNVRYASFLFYWGKITQNIFTFILGYGVPNDQLTHFSKEMSRWTNMFGLYTSDIGIIGQWFHYGLVYILIYLSIVYKIMIKLGKYIPAYIKLFVVSTFFISIMIFPFTGPLYYIIWSLVLYLCDLHINRFALRVRK